jgi:hypothetical protein
LLNSFVNNNKSEIINWNNCWERFFCLQSSSWSLENTEKICFTFPPSNNNNDDETNGKNENRILELLDSNILPPHFFLLNELLRLSCVVHEIFLNEFNLKYLWDDINRMCCGLWESKIFWEILENEQ